ncbi:MAG: AMP-binding protein [Chloroflexi bacterium]|nr:AMP-binding protein [Chloroflexota bacterium]
MIIQSPWPSLEPYVPMTLPEFLKRPADRFHDKPCLINMDGTQYTFGQVWEAGKRLGHFLQDQGIGKGDRIAILSANNPEYVVAFQGIVHAGAVVTTLNPLYKEREIIHQLEDCGASAIFVMRFFEGPVQNLREQIPGLRHIWAIEDVWELAKESPPEPKDPGTDPEKDLVALPYSSGTTGLPKGVMISHFNLVSNIRQLASAGLTNAYSTYLDFLPFFHIYGLTVLMNSGFSAGVTQVLMPRFDTQACLDLIRRYKVTNLFVVPPALLALANFPEPEKFDTSTLSFILSGAAPLPLEVANRAQQAYGCTILQGYGLTETSAVANANPYNRVKITSVGPPISDTREKVVDVTDGRELGPGEPGELLISGPQIMQGYWQNPQETADTITPDGWLRTGDIAQFDEDGYVYVIDRKKELIKYKGYQVAPAELEALLMEHPAVLDAAVIPKPDTAEATEVPKAFIVLRPGQQADAKELMRFVEERVAPYKKVRELEFVEAIPKTLSGKILRRDLIEQERAKGASPRRQM